MSAFRSIVLIALAVFSTPLRAQSKPVPERKLLAGTSLAVPAVSGNRPVTKLDLDTWLDGYMPYALKRGDIAGAVVVVVKDGHVLTQRGFGYSDVAKRTPVNPETTIFRPGSVSKLFTWTAVMQLVEQGKLNLDKDVNTYLDFKIPAYNGKPITLRNIMTHTAGFEEVVQNVIIADKSNIQPLGAALKRLIPERIFAPGTTPAYSNYGAGLAGYIVQRVSGEPFETYVQRHIFAPLQMNHSSFSQPLPANLLPLVSKGYDKASGEPRPIEFVNPAPAGALAATGADMAKFMIAHLNNGGPLLRPDTTSLMHSTKLTILPPLNRMALGFYEENINGHPVIGHGGDTWWFHSAVWLFTDDNVGIFMSANSTGKDSAVASVREGLFEGFSDRYFPKAATDTRVDAKLALEHVRMMAGTYISSRRVESNFFKMVELGAQFKVGVNADGSLAFGSGDTKWIEVAPFVWHELNGHERIAAQLIDGKVVRVSFDGVSPIIVYDRAPWYRSTAWIMPALLISLVALALTAIAWPIAAITRRRYCAVLALSGRDRKAYRLVHILAAAAVAVLLGWIIGISIMASDMDNLDGRFSWLIWTLQIAGVLIFPGLLGAAVWNGWQTWTGKRGWFSRLWSVLLILAAFFTLWTAVVFNIISFGASF